MSPQRQVLTSASSIVALPASFCFAAAAALLRRQNLWSFAHLMCVLFPVCPARSCCTKPDWEAELGQKKAKTAVCFHRKNPLSPAVVIHRRCKCKKNKPSHYSLHSPLLGMSPDVDFYTNNKNTHNYMFHNSQRFSGIVRGALQTFTHETKNPRSERAPAEKVHMFAPPACLQPTDKLVLHGLQQSLVCVFRLHGSGALPGQHGANQMLPAAWK